MAAKVLLLDIETSPILAHVWKLWDNNVPLNMMHSDWQIMSWAAKWLGEPSSKVVVRDQMTMKSLGDDKPLLRELSKLLKKADVIITHNGIKFDQKRINARLAFHGMKPVNHYRHIDTCALASRVFGFTSNKLEYLAKYLKTKTVKLTERQFNGFELWSECLKGNKKAWREMALYNSLDVIVLEQVYHKLAPWDNKISFDVYHDGIVTQCQCGSKNIIKDGFYFSNVGKFQVYECQDCGHHTRSKINLLHKEKRKSLRR